MMERRTLVRSLPLLGFGAATLASCQQEKVTLEASVCEPTLSGQAPEIDLFYIDKGKGDPLLFIPGFTLSSDVFVHQVNAFAEHYRVIVIDPRSHGKSPMTLEGNNYPQHGADLHNLIECLDLRDITIVGWSFGALSAWSYAEQFGTDRLRTFVAIDMPPVPLSGNEGADIWVEAPVSSLSEAYHILANREGQAESMRDYAQSIMVQRDLTESELQEIVSWSLKTPPVIAQALFASGFFSDYLEIAKKIDIQLPSLMVVGDYWADTALPYLSRELPNTDVSVLGWHMMFWEHHEQFNKLLLSWLGAQEK